MTLLVIVLAIATVPAIYCAYDLHRLRKDAARMVADIERQRALTERLLVDAQAIHDAAVAFGRDSVRRWLDVVQTERRIH